VRGIGDPDRRQFAGTVQLRQHHRVATIHFDPSPDFIGIREGATTMQLCPQPVSKRKPIPARTGFVAEAQPTAGLAEPSRHLAHDLRAVRENPDLPHLTTASALGDCRANRCVVHINPTYVISSIRPVPMHEALCRPSGATLDIVHAERRAADH
jgi:hypothetical protein